MALSWNEIKKRAVEFSNEWKDESSEKAEAQTFWNEFFNVFGITRRRVATFEKDIELDEKHGYIDLFWKKNLVVEHKSEGKDLDRAYSQALGYFEGLREEDLPRYVIVSDFKRFKLYDLDESKDYEFTLEELPGKTYLFHFMLGHKRKTYEEEDPVNVRAAVLMGNLHDSLKENRYEGHPLEVLLVRLMFCLFADDTNIFEKDIFRNYIENRTKEDGSDVGLHLISMFQTLNTEDDKRQKHLDEDLKKFQYINGNLFEERLPIPSFNSDTRRLLLRCCNFDWHLVSPAVFGSMFQSVMDAKERRDFGAHYTSETNIMKTISGLFLDDLTERFNSHRSNKAYLRKLLDEISAIKILDPACGCGNFLIIAYRELRRLEIRIHKRIRKIEGKEDQKLLPSFFDSGINVDSMYGVEILEFPVRVAETALWLVDHQVNEELSKEFGFYYARLPLKVAPNIINGNALRMNWGDIVPKNELSYVLGNPPYVGKKRRDDEQKEDMKTICGHIEKYGTLDYVCCWYVKAADFIEDTDIKVGFVSTNSITQGEQVGVLWDYLLNAKQIKIHFAHRTFKWLNQAKGKANVGVVIIGFALVDAKKRLLYDYETPTSDPFEIKAKNINAYLVDQKDIIITNRGKPISEVPEITFGSMPNDDGNFLFTDDEKKAFLREEPEAKKYIRPFISAREYLNNEKRWCLWLVGINPSEIRKLEKVQERIRNVREMRLQSKRESTRKLADTPYLFGEIRQPTSGKYILIPLHSSENRKYIPIDFLSHHNIANNSCSIIQSATLYHFGVLTSAIHMAWVNQICGRLETRTRYSNKLVYNNFPWPENPSGKRKEEIEKYVEELLEIRRGYKDSSLADLYDPLYMPKDILKAHKKLDRAVDKCYRTKPFKTDLERLEFLFEMYDKLNSETD